MYPFNETPVAVTLVAYVVCTIGVLLVVAIPLLLYVLVDPLEFEPFEPDDPPVFVEKLIVSPYDWPSIFCATRRTVYVILGSISMTPVETFPAVLRVPLPNDDTIPFSFSSNQ